MSKARFFKLTSDGERSLANSKKFILLSLLACVFLSHFSPKAFALDTHLDYQVKAAMTYKFLSYSEWPVTQFGNPQSPYRIWVLGSPTIKSELQNMVANRIIKGRPIEVYSAATVDAIDDAHIVFVARDMELALPRLSALAEKNSYLVVTENEQGLVEGSTINLRLVNGRVGFDISLKCAQLNHVTLSSNLLAIAVSIEEGKR